MLRLVRQLTGKPVSQAVAGTSAFGETFDLLLPTVDGEYSNLRKVAPCEFFLLFSYRNRQLVPSTEVAGVAV